MTVAFDVAVVGGGPAGLSAALVLGRARRRTLVLDAGAPRNALSPAAHGVFTRDGTPPAELLREARAQLAPYPAVTLHDAAAVAARAVDDGFELELAGGGRACATRLLLAVGVRDELPPIEGLAPLWGTRVLHCPYCHGWEVSDEALALHLPDRSSPLLALLPGWSRDLVVCADGPAVLTGDDRALLARRAIRVVESPLRKVEAAGDGVLLHFADGRALPRRALFVRPPYSIASPLPRALGCRITETGTIDVGPDHQTSVPGVYAAGDCAGPVHQVVVAAASGHQAAMAINRELADAELRS